MEPAGGPSQPRAACVVLGAGGHARVVVDTLRASGGPNPYAVLDVDPTRWGDELLGVPILGGDELLPDLVRKGVGYFVVGVGGVGDNRPRRRIFELGLAQGLVPLSLRHPSAVCSEWARLGPGTVLCPGALVNAGAVLGANVIVNTGAIVEHDCVIGDHVHIATGARLAGAVTVGAGAHVGAGATVLQGRSVGADAVVGAGAVVIDDVAPNTLVVGVPARCVRRGVLEADRASTK